jgi:hypothetical protein
MFAKLCSILIGITLFATLHLSFLFHRTTVVAQKHKSCFRSKLPSSILATIILAMLVAAAAERSPVSHSRKQSSISTKHRRSTGGREAAPGSPSALGEMIWAQVDSNCLSSSSWLTGATTREWILNLSSPPSNSFSCSLLRRCRILHGDDNIAIATQKVVIIDTPYSNPH